MVPFTTSFDDRLYPVEVLVREGEGPLDEDSIGICSQVLTVSIEHRATENLGAIPGARMDEVGGAPE